MLWLYKRIIFGNLINVDHKKLIDLKKVEILIFSSLIFPIIFFGFYPEPLLNSVETSVTNLIEMYNFNINNNLALNK